MIGAARRNALNGRDGMRPLKEFIARENVADLGIGEASDLIAQLVDLAGDQINEEGLRRSLAWCDELERRHLADRELALINYFRANAWANLERVRHQADGNTGRWSWDQPEAEQQILCLRRALNGPGFPSLERGRQCQILTNLANLMNTAGRFVEALECWARVLAIAPQFWMARGNRGGGLLHYARSLYDPGHRAVFLLFAYKDLEEASSPEPRHMAWGDPAAAAHFIRQRAEIESAADIAAIAAAFQPNGYALGRSAEERAYRAWCLHHTLFLNPLNDLAAHSVAAQDILTLPDFVAPILEPPVVVGLFNQIKQEYVSARWEYYLGVQATRPHFSDRDVLLYNTLDYPSYGLGVERVKVAYKAAYSIFDKIAFFLNHYLSLGIRPKQVSFRSIWRERNGDPIHPIRPAFQQSENWPLRGLFWLSKDLFDERHSVLTDPESRALHELRIHLEHRYVKVRELMSDEQRDPSDPDLFFDTLAYSISRRTLEERALRLLKLVRAALIYLSLGMHCEEKRRREARGDGLNMPMPLDPWRDSWKR